MANQTVAKENRVSVDVSESEGVMAKPRRTQTPPVRDWEGIDLFEKMPLLKKIIKLRGFQFWTILPNLLLFYVFILAGLFGSPIGNRNIIIVCVWILWWFVLISALVPFASRIWCTMCPLPVFGEWLQRLRLVNVRVGEGPKKLNTKMFGLNRDWPKPLRNIWLQNIGFLCLATISALLVTRPIVSVSVLGGMILLAIVLSLIFRLRSFCMYLCPVSGFLGLYSMTSTLGLRVRDPGVCKAHTGKECIRGCNKSYGCPWFQYVGNMTRNNYCGLCMECVKGCPHDNITLYLRPFCSDIKLKSIDEAFKAFIMIVLAMVYSITLLGPWGWIKNLANPPESGNWGGFALYAGLIFLMCLGILPGIHWAVVWLGRIWSGNLKLRMKDIFTQYAYMWVPLGLLAWIAFSVPLIMVNGAYIVSVISDPFGKGWDLFGTAHVPWTPIYPEWVVYLQIPLLLIGLYYSLKSTYKVAINLMPDDRKAIKSMIPIGALAVTVTIGFLRLFVG